MTLMASWSFVALSLSARRAWIEIMLLAESSPKLPVALRKESVDRNITTGVRWAESSRVALRKESVDRNALWLLTYHLKFGSRSPQGERG